jgi:hypothetical protein
MIESLRHIWRQVAPHMPVDLLSQTPVVAGAAGALAVGILLLLWARPLGRALLALVGIGAGLALGPAAASSLGVDVLVGRIALAAVFGLIGVLAARAMWALLLGVLAGATTGAMMILHHLQFVPAEKLPELHAPQSWTWPYLAEAAANYLWNHMALAHGQNPVMLVAGVLAAVIAGLAVGMLFPTMATIFVASLLGALLVVLSSQVLFLGGGGQPFPEAMGQPAAALSVTAALMLAGLVVQGISARKARKAEKKEKEDADRQKHEADGRRKEKDGGDN